MTTRTITVNTPEETEVQICDECGLGDDHGELVAFEPADSDLDAELHYHRDCAREQTGNPQTLSEAYHEAVEAEFEYQVALVLTKFGLRWLLVSSTLFVIGAVIAVVEGIVFVPVAMMALGATMVGLTLYVGRQNGDRTAEELA